METTKSEVEAAAMTDAEYMRKRLLEYKEAAEKPAKTAAVAINAVAMRLKYTKKVRRVSKSEIHFFKT